MEAPGLIPDDATSRIPPLVDTPLSQHEERTGGEAVSPQRFPIVGIGASAGGVRAFEQFFKRMRPDSGMAFVVVQHLASDRKSELPRILQQHTAMSVCEVDDGVLITPDCVYVIPPSQQLTIRERTLRLTDPASQRGHSAPLDVFFRTLAEDQKEFSIGIILSGQGTDGAAGLRAIKQAGGITMVQKPEEAEYDSMPASAIATGIVDFVLPLDQLADRLLELSQRDEHPLAERTEEIPKDDATALHSIFAHLRTQTGHDFTHYKRSTVLRRLERRMLVHQVEHLSDYLAILLEKPDEVSSLLNSLLISVTHFFRDTEAFKALEDQVISRLFREAPEGLRVWIPGCSTGEEAYTLAMLLAEYRSRHDEAVGFQIFATDIDASAIEIARDGIYSEAIASDVSPERLERFFAWEGEGYRVRKELREKVLFAAHSLIKDPPFSRLDLISCRNVLIYLNRDVQDQVFDLFHYALRPGGYLFLGMSESADRVSNLFTTLDKKHHIFQRRSVARTMPRLTAPPVTRLERPEPLPSRKGADRRAQSFAELHNRLLLERYAPPSIIVSESNDVLHVTGNAGRFLQIREGEPTQNILRMIVKELRIELRTSLHQARQQGQPVRSGAVRLNLEGQPRQVTLFVLPISEPEGVSGFLQVVFEEMPAKTLEAPPAVPTETDRLIEQLEDELLRSKESLQASIEDLERSNEELKASNEELLSTNEELQSTAEELETSQEELQSMNEELVTVNLELKEKIEEVSRSNSDLQNLIISTDIGTIFLDRELRIKRYTPRISDLFNITPSDIGRPLAHFTHRIDYDNLLELADRVLNRVTSIEREIRSRDDRWYLVRILPYRTVENKIDGVVVTFVDVTDRRRAETILTRQQQQIRALVEHAPDVIARFDREYRHVYVNPAIEQITGMARQNFLGKTNRELDFPAESNALWENALRQVLDTGKELTTEFEYARLGKTYYFSSRLVPERGPDGTVETVLAITRDISDRKQKENALQDSERRFRNMADTVPVLIWVSGPDKKCTYFNKSWLEFTGKKLEQEVGDGWTEGIHPDDFERCTHTYESAFDAREAFAMEYRLRRYDGMYRWVLDNGVPQFSLEGEFLGYIGSCIDIHDAKELESKLRQRALQQAAVAELGLRALETASIQELMDLVVGRICETLEVSYCNIYELQPDGRFMLRAGSGWRPEIVSQAPIEAVGTLAAYALQASVPVTVENFATETRFSPSTLLQEHEVTSGMSVSIRGTSGPFGVLGVHTTELRNFSKDDQNFLQAVANLLGDAIERLRTQELFRQGQQEQADHALRESEGRWRRMVEQNPDPVMISAQGKVLYINPAGARLLGAAGPEELAGRSLFDFAPEHFHSEGQARLKTVEKGQPTTPLVTRLLRLDGSEVEAETFSTPIIFEGQPAAQTVIRDLTGRRNAEEEVRRSEERFAKAFRAAPVAMMITRLGSGRIVDANEHFEQMTGFAREEVVGRKAAKVGLSVHRILRDRVGNILEQTEGYENIEALISTKSGDTLDVLSSGEVIEFGGETCLLSMFYDITERKQLERTVLEIAEEERRRIGQDLHDGLGQQLTGIAFLSKVVEQNLKAASSEQAQQMHRIIELLSQAVSYTRNLSRVLSPVDVQADGLADALRRLAGSTEDYFSISCRFEAEPDVRVANSGMATHLYRIAQEAVNNAMKHAEAQGIVIQLSVVNDHGVLRIQDNGRGLPDTSGALPSGMGMRTMRYRSNVIGGTLDIYPAEGRGTVVEVRFPRSREVAD
jgi:two-component system, chemotaxis family, CheB/CheR fusion protein